MPKYNSPDKIPARIFFEILKNKDYQLLKPKPGEAGLKEVFEGLDDYYFLTSDNPEAKEFLSLSNSINAQQYKITFIENVLRLLFNTSEMPEFIEMRHEWFDTFKKDFGIVMDKSADVLDEIKRVQQKDLGHLRNDLNFAKNDYDALLKNMTPSKEEYNFYAAAVNLGSALQGNTMVNADMSLAVYVAAENEAKRLNREFKARQRNGKR